MPYVYIILGNLMAASSTIFMCLCGHLDIIVLPMTIFGMIAAVVGIKKRTIKNKKQYLLSRQRQKYGAALILSCHQRFQVT